MVAQAPDMGVQYILPLQLGEDCGDLFLSPVHHMSSSQPCFVLAQLYQEQGFCSYIVLKREDMKERWDRVWVYVCHFKMPP